MSMNFLLKFLAGVVMVSLFNVVASAPIPATTTTENSVAWLSYPAKGKKFQKAINLLIKDYDKDSRVA